MTDRMVAMSPPPAATPPGAVVELPNLDLLRACAVLAVVADHTITMIGVSLGVIVTPFVWHLGRIGVVTFFVHTSLVLMQSMARTPLDGWRLFAHFYTRRIFRIYPLSILCVLIVLTLGAPRVAWEEPTSWTLGSIVSNLLLIQNLTHSRSVLGPMWSLPYELQMYVFLPLMFRLLQRVPPMAAALALWALSVIAAIVQPLAPGASRLDLAVYGPCFVAGVVAYAGLLRFSPRLPSWSWPLVVAGLMGIYVGVSLVTGEIHAEWITWPYCALVALAIPFARQITSPLLVRASHLVARYSYGIYLFHMIALWLAFAAAPFSLGLAVGLAAAICVAMSVAAYHLIEKPGIALGGRVARWLVAQRAPAPEAAVVPARADS